MPARSKPLIGGKLLGNDWVFRTWVCQTKNKLSEHRPLLTRAIHIIRINVTQDFPGGLEANAINELHHIDIIMIKRLTMPGIDNRRRTAPQGGIRNQGLRLRCRIVDRAQGGIGVVDGCILSDMIRRYPAALMGPGSARQVATADQASGARSPGDSLTNLNR